MPKASTRFRNRKINFKTRISIRTGTSALDFEEDSFGQEDDLDGEGSGPDGKGASGAGEKDANKVETGVDKEEEHEHHLQAALAAATGSSSARHSSSTRSTNATPGSPSKPIPKAYIPTPDSAGLIDPELFRSLYPPNSYVDPNSYIRFSDTVEDAQIGATEYTMDEEDEDWLEEFNVKLAAGVSTSAPNQSSSPTQPNGTGSLPLDPVANGAINGRSSRDRKGKGEKGKLLAAGVSSSSTDGTDKMDKGKEVALGPVGPLSEDDFELVMESFEKTTEVKAPMAHVDTNLLPSLVDMELAFSEPEPGSGPLSGHEMRSRMHLVTLKSFARLVYPHWRERRLARNGKQIIPQLDYDESNENNPYVCFRRRELKTSRKTRRSDQQNIERLIRLRNDLFAAHALMVKTRDRERLKLESVELERKIFLKRCEVRELKRKLGEVEGDEDVLIGRREKRPKRGDTLQSGIRVSLRKPDSFSPTTLGTSVEELKARKENAAALVQKMERDQVKKREADQNWEDWTDGAYLSRMAPTPARYWRTVEPVPGSIPLNGPNGKYEALGFGTAPQPAFGHVRTSFRKRIGRGGRVMLDRLAPGMGRGVRRLPSTPTSTLGIARAPWEESDKSDDDEEEDDEEEDLNAIARRQERFKYDSDASIDFPSIDEPSVIDDFHQTYAIKRACLLTSSDAESLTLDSAYLDEALRYVSLPPEHQPPPQIFGRVPPRAPLSAQPGGPGGQLIGGSPAANANMSIMMAANEAHRRSQQELHKRMQGQAAASAGVNGSPIPLPNQLPMPMGMNGAPRQPPPQWMNGQQLPSKVDPAGIVLPPGFANHLQAGQSIPNGMLMAQQQAGVQRMPSGANGMPATSRLSAPPFSNPSPIQQGQGSPHPLSSPLPLHQQRPTSANSEHRPPSQMPPSRPTSAASSHHSPSVISQGLPLQQPMLSPGLLGANGKRNQIYPTSMQAGAQALKQPGMLPFSNGATFVQS